MKKEKFFTIGEAAARARTTAKPSGTTTDRAGQTQQEKTHGPAIAIIRDRTS